MKKIRNEEEKVIIRKQIRLIQLTKTEDKTIIIKIHVEKRNEEQIIF